LGGVERRSATQHLSPSRGRGRAAAERGGPGEGVMRPSPEGFRRSTPLTLRTPSRDRPTVMAAPCPYPDCPPDPRPAGPVPAHGVWVCPGCGRPSAACLQMIGTAVCGALNRPVASFCRRCGSALPAAWYAEQTAAGLASEDGQVVSL